MYFVEGVIRARCPISRLDVEKTGAQKDNDRRAENHGVADEYDDVRSDVEQAQTHSWPTWPRYFP